MFYASGTFKHFFLHLGVNENNHLLPGRVYFLTLSIVGGVDIFTKRLYADIALEGLRYYQLNKRISIFAYVIMSSYIQLLVRPGNETINGLFGRFKSYTSKQILHSIEQGDDEVRKNWLLMIFRYHAKYKAGFDEYHFWGSDNQVMVIESEFDFLEKVEFIHSNPVRCGFVTSPGDWRCSSAHRNSPLTMDIFNFL